MAKCEIKMPDEFLKNLSSLQEDLDKVAESALKAGAEVALSKMKNNLNSVIGKNLKSEPRSTGELASSLGISRVLVDKNGRSNIKVGFAEPRSDGDSNAKIATILEYGTSTMQAKPFLKSTKSQSKSEVIAAMKNVLDEEINRR